MLPNLKSLEFSKILPLSEKSIEHIVFKEGINKFYAENGSGKTTLTDLIEHSLVRDAHAFAWNVFSKKRVDKNAYVKADWIFGTEKVSITHELTDAGARTRATSPKFSNKAHTKDMYSDLLYSKTNLSLEQMQKIFEGVYYKRENDLNLLGTPGEENLMDFFELLNKAIRIDTPTTIKMRNQIGEVKRQIDIRRANKRKYEATLEKMEIIFAGADSSAEAMDSIGARKGDLQRDNNKLRNEMDKLRTDLAELEEEDEKLLDQLDKEQETLLEVRLKIDNLKSNKYSMENDLKSLQNEKEGFDKLGKVNYEEIKTAWKKKEICELCGTSIYNKWNERIEKGCPVCGTGWKNIQQTVKDAVKNNTKNLDKEARNIQEEMENLIHELRTIEEDIAKHEKKEEEITNTLKKSRDKLAINNTRRRKIQQQNEEINQKIQRIGVEMGSLSAQEKMVNQEESIGLIKVNLERINAELEDLYAQLARLERELPEQKELQQILNNFTRSTKEIFGYSMLADTDTRVITISKDDSVRDFAAMSWSERYFIDVVFRMAIFHFLIENGIMKRGLIILDSPEAALDPYRLDLLANLINKNKDRINFVIATRVQNFYQDLDGNPLEIKKQTQTSLFDFITA